MIEETLIPDEAYRVGKRKQYGVRGCRLQVWGVPLARQVAGKG